MKPKISATSISLFLRCPFKYKLRYIDELEESLTDLAVTGKEIHKIIEEEQTLESALNAALTSEAISNRYRSMAISSIEYVFSLDEFDRDRSLLEHEFEIEFDDFILKGVFDVVLIDEDGEPFGILDWKFSMSNPTPEKYRLQASVYSLAFKKLFGNSPRLVKFVNIHKKSHVSFTTKSLEFSEEVLTKQVIPYIIKNVKDQFYPKIGMFNGSCRYCGYREVCIQDREPKLLGILYAVRPNSP